MSDPMHDLEIKRLKQVRRNKLDSMFREKDEEGGHLYLTDPSYRDEVSALMEKNLDVFGNTHA